MPINPASTGILRIDSSRNAEYLYADRPKVGLFKSVGRFFGKAVNFLGRIAAPVVAIAVPGLGLPLAAGIYGASSLGGHLAYKSEANDAAKMQEWMASKQNLNVVLPGLFEQATTADIKTDFITPQPLMPQATMTIVDRELAQHSSVENFRF
ncbi:MAG: hypothetical protein HQM16_13445 [Deltaproteobacteria bacterium]|nr:hypothetical protein [Deltaproteobacteria bacterium]